MVQIEQYDTTNAWFTICSVGAVFSLVFSVMGIKWWFRKRITFEHDPSVESIGRPGRSHQNISVATTGIYRASKDVDSFEISERPKSLPPVKTRPSSGQPFLPVRHTFVDNKEVSQGQRPVPEEIIPIPEERIPKSPPSTPLTAIKDDYSKPVVIDINIPGESGYVLQTENELSKPEVHQRLTLSDENISQEIDKIEIEPVMPKPRARKRISVAETTETEMSKSLSDLEQYRTPAVFETVVIKSNSEEDVPKQSKGITDSDEYGSSEIVASSEKLNEFEAFIEQERKIMEALKQEQHFTPVEINEEEQVVPEPTEAPPVQEAIAQEEPQVPEKTKLPYLDLEETLDPSKIVSPKPRMRKGILKKKAPPVPVIIAMEEKQPVDTFVQQENNENQHTTIRWTDSDENKTTEDETNVKKGVKFDNSEPDIIPDKSENEKRRVVDIIQEIEEATREYEEFVEVEEGSEPIKEEVVVEENKSFIQVIEVNIPEEGNENNEKDFTQVIKIESLDEEDKKIEKTDLPEVSEVETIKEVIVKTPDNILEDQENVREVLLQNSDATTPIKNDVEEGKLVSIVEFIKEGAQEISISNQVPDEMEDEAIILKKHVMLNNDDNAVEQHESVVNEILNHDLPIGDQVEVDEVKIVEILEETQKIDPPTKEPVPTPRKMIKITQDETPEINIKEKEVVQPSFETWEPQTIIHNDQVLVMSPPPTYPPPMLPNSYLSDDSEESVSSDEYDENNPPKPPKRYRIYVVNSDNGDAKVKPILKTRPPVKRVSFDNASPDIYLRTPDIPSSVDTDTESLVSPLMPNALSDVSPRKRSVGFDSVLEKKDTVTHDKETEQEVTSTQETPVKPLLELNNTPPNTPLDIQSPLDEKIAHFKLLAEKLNDSPVKSPDREFAELLSPDPVNNDKGFNGFDEKRSEFKSIPVTETIVTEMPEVRSESIPRPTSLLLKETSKKPRRQLSEPVLSPRDALLEEIRSFGDKKKLAKRDYVGKVDTGVDNSKGEGVKVDIEEALI